MTAPRSLPEPLGHRRSFTVGDAAAFGVGRDRLSRSDLVPAYHGVRAHVLPVGMRDRALTYLPRLRAGQVFSHVTAAVLLGIPVPPALTDGPLDVSALYPAQAPRTSGVRGHRLQDRPGLLDARGRPITSAAETWCQLGAVLDLEALVTAGDHLVRRGVDDPARVLDELAEAAGVVRRAGADRLLPARALIRPGVRSPMESVLRFTLVRAGLAEPLVNVPIYDARGRWLGEGDLVYPEVQELLEYEGDGHRVDKRQFRKDIRRREDFADAGWGTTRVTADDLTIHRRALISRVARRTGQPDPFDRPLSRSDDRRRAPRLGRDARLRALDWG